MKKTVHLLCQEITSLIIDIIKKQPTVSKFLLFCSITQKLGHTGNFLSQSSHPHNHRYLLNLAKKEQILLFALKKINHGNFLHTSLSKIILITLIIIFNDIKSEMLKNRGKKKSSFFVH